MKMTLDEAIKHLNENLADQSHDWGCEECKAEHEQLAEWLRELKEAKRLYKMAVSIINNSFPEVGSCWGCANHDEVNDECKGGAFAECAEVCKWKYADEALKLIGGEEDENSI